MSVQNLIDIYTQARAHRDILQENLEGKERLLGVLREKNAAQIKARWVLTEVEQLTQRRFQSKVENLVTMAIRSVFDRPFTFHLEFERKRNRMECRPVITEDDHVYDDPEYDLGGGFLDIVSFALRIVLWSLQKPKGRNVIVLDEPMKNMGKLIILGGQVLKEISHKLNLQLLIVTHDESLVEIGDRVFRITHDGKKSHVECIKKGDQNQNDAANVGLQQKQDPAPRTKTRIAR